jgi:hypothetical protein
VDGERRGERFRSFAYGALLGASAAVAAARRRRRPPHRDTPAGLAAFEGAPCFRETLEREAARSTAGEPSR